MKTTSSLEKVIYFQDYVVIDPGTTELEPQQLLTEEEYRAAREQYGDGLVRSRHGCRSGSQAADNKLDLVHALREQLRVELEETGSKQKKKDLINRLKIVESIRDSDNKPRVDGAGRDSRDPARPASARSARQRQLRHQ